jgi:hypothetical protein
MTARMQTVREMAQECGVSERFMAQCLYVMKKGIPGIFHLVSSHGLNVPELTLMVNHLPEEAQRAWAALPPDDLHRAIRNLRREIRETARVQSPPDELTRLRARVAELEAEVRRLGGVPNGTRRVGL